MPYAVGVAESGSDFVSMHPPSGTNPSGNRFPALTDLHQQAGSLGESVPDLDELLQQFVSETATQSDLQSAADLAAFLDWIIEHPERSEELCDWVELLRTRLPVERVALQQRLAHLRFQELLKSTPERKSQLGTRRKMRLHLNPVRVWATCGSGTDSTETSTGPSPVLFYAVGNDVHHAILDAEAEWTVRTLERGSLRLSALLGPVCCLRRMTTLSMIESLIDQQILAIS